MSKPGNDPQAHRDIAQTVASDARQGYEQAPEGGSEALSIQTANRHNTTAAKLERAQNQ
ncbi:hypothetical protein [Kitasatospora griseola]|uniref:hypothetical protein n=1 Tax=Kitasatospora griseola TaxID=2064 RepID=UPI000A70A272|nr:hypothetical protein [Kitasatospora griseola]